MRNLGIRKSGGPVVWSGVSLLVGQLSHYNYLQYIMLEPVTARVWEIHAYSYSFHFSGMLSCHICLIDMFCFNFHRDYTGIQFTVLWYIAYLSVKCCKVYYVWTITELYTFYSLVVYMLWITYQHYQQQHQHNHQHHLCQSSTNTNINKIIIPCYFLFAGNESDDPYPPSTRQQAPPVHPQVPPRISKYNCIFIIS